MTLTPRKVTLLALVLAFASATGLALAQQTKPTSAFDRDGRPVRPSVAIDNVCAWPALVLLPDGAITAFIFNQPSHGRMIGDIDCYASTDGGESWQKRGTPAPHEPGVEQNRMNVAAGLAANGDLLVIASGYELHPKPNQHGPYEIGKVLRACVSRSSDGGVTWSVDKQAFPETAPDGASLIPFGTVVRARDGLRVTAYSAFTKDPGAYVIRSDDDGRTWKDPVRIQTPLRINETTLWSDGQGNLLAAARERRLEIFRSADDGKTWSHVGAASEPRGIPGHLLLLNDGRLLVSHGNREKDNEGVDVRVSEDGGKTWSKPVRVADFVGYDGGYPSSVQRDDGQVVTAFYARRTREHDRYHMGVVIWDPATSLGKE